MISLDSIVLFLFSGILYKKILMLSTLRGSEQVKYATVSLMFILLLVYILYDYLHSKTEDKFRIKSMILSVFLLFFLVYPLFTIIDARNRSSLQFTRPEEMIEKFPGGYRVDTDLASYLMTSDSLFATEQAIGFFARGKNPYRENYSGTMMKSFGEGNPAFVHYVYLPAMFVLPAPFYIIWNKVFGWYDHRIFQLFFYLGAILVLSKFMKDRARKLLTVIFFAMNPILLQSFLEGLNDIVMLFWLMLAILLLERKSFVPALVCFAVTCSLKQFSWFFAPFFFLRYKHLARLEWKGLLLKSYPFFLVFGLFIIPFLLWDTHNFIDDVYLCLIGKSSVNYPIGCANEFGVCQILINLGLIGPGKRFPFWILQVLIGFPLCITLAIKQYFDNTLPRLIMGGTLTMFVFSFFSGIFHVNYIGVIMFLILFAWSVSYREELIGPGKQ